MLWVPCPAEFCEPGFHRCNWRNLTYMHPMEVLHTASARRAGVVDLPPWKTTLFSWSWQKFNGEHVSFVICLLIGATSTARCHFVTLCKVFKSKPCLVFKCLRTIPPYQLIRSGIIFSYSLCKTICVHFQIKKKTWLAIHQLLLYFGNFHIILGQYTTNPRSPEGTFPKQPLSKLLTLHWTPGKPTGKPMENRWKLPSETHDPNHPTKYTLLKHT